MQNVFVHEELVWDPETGQFLPGRRLLFFDTWARNLGTVSLEVAVEEADGGARSVAQCVSWWTDRTCARREPVGGYTFHDEHSHFHFEEFATYEVRRLGPDGRADQSEAGLIATSDKVSFCMVDSAPVRADASPAPFYVLCLPTVQGISAGWADIYDSSLEGQQLPVDGLDDGRYALIVTINYGGKLHETHYVDNTLEATIEFSNGMTQVAIVDRHYR